MDSTSAFDKEVAAGEVVVPVQGNTSRAGPRPPKLEASDPFLLVYDPTRYTVMEGHVIPQFRRLALMPGVNGVDSIRDRRTGEIVGVNSGMAVAMAADRGHTIIPLDAIPQSQHHLHNNGGRSYIWRPSGTAAHLDIWTRAFSGSKKIVCDAANYIAWIEWLEETRVIPPAPSHVLQDLLAQKTEERDRMSDRAQTVPSLKVLVSHLTRDVEAIEAVLRARGVATDEDEDDGPPADAVEVGGAPVVVEGVPTRGRKGHN